MCVYRNELKEKNDRKQRVKNVFTLVVCLFFFFFAIRDLKSRTQGVQLSTSL